MSWKTDPIRRALPFKEWPQADRNGWTAAIEEGDILDGQGPAAHWSSATHSTNVQHYGRWLGYVKYVGGPLESVSPERRMRPELVKAYSLHLETLVAPITRLSMLVGMKEMIRVMHPGGDWRWLQDFCNAIQRTAKPSRDKRSLIRPAKEVYGAALKELKRLQREPDTRDNRLLFRDTLMLGMCAGRPLRAKNLREMGIGKNLLQLDDRWLLIVEEADVKNREHLEYFVPHSLVPYLLHYLEEVRPHFPQSNQTDALWLCKTGLCKDSRFPYWWITKTSKRLLGVAINPHLLRDCVATDLAEHAPSAIAGAAVMLGHRQLKTTRKYYVHASNMRASQKINSILEDVKNTPERCL